MIYYSDYDLDNYCDYKIKGDMITIDSIKYRLIKADKDGVWVARL